MACERTALVCFGFLIRRPEVVDFRVGNDNAIKGVAEILETTCETLICPVEPVEIGAVVQESVQ